MHIRAFVPSRTPTFILCVSLQKKLFSRHTLFLECANLRGPPRKYSAGIFIGENVHHLPVWTDILNKSTSRSNVLAREITTKGKWDVQISFLHTARGGVVADSPESFFPSTNLLTNLLLPSALTRNKSLIFVINSQVIIA